MVYVFAFYFLFHNNLPFCSRIHHYSFPLKSSIFLKFDLYFLHFCNFDLQLQLHLHILLIHYALNSISALVAMRFCLDHTHPLSHAQITHTLAHSHRFRSFRSRSRLCTSHISCCSSPGIVPGGRHFFALNTLLLLCFRVFFVNFLRQMPSIREF